ncbi:ATP-binding protein [Kribbella sp. NPDC051952]|uniref:AAA family ATPase n=1 Tax=Kribbella sp. NPDC051952 TaxID=3154851 RepID=UPI00342FE054
MSGVTLFLMVGLPGAGKTTRAQELARAHDALRFTPDEWHLSLFGTSLRAEGKRDLLEGWMITAALRTLRLGTSVVLDFGLWSRDDRSALRWLADQVGVPCQVVYLPVDLDVQLARIAHREASMPQTFPMPEADVVSWRTKFEAPDDAELAGVDSFGPPGQWTTWLAWAQDRWPTLIADYS